MLFALLFVPDRSRDAVSGSAWIQAMLDAEAALALAEATVGLIPSAAAESIARCCISEHVDVDALSVEARAAGNPAEPLARALRTMVPEDVRRYVHHGATSQDILDTAGMLIASRTLEYIELDMSRLMSHLARLAEEHRETLMVGRTLSQHALPITFGLKAAGWLEGATRAFAGLRHLHDDCLAVQLGGGAGTLSALGVHGVAVLHEFAHILQLNEPDLPWHTERGRIAEIGAALFRTAGALDKIALDITLLAQTEVGEVIEDSEGRRGGSSTMPQKHNPVGSVLTRACSREAQSGSELLLRSMAQEQERSTGIWQAEWQAMSDALAFTGGAVAWLGETMAGLKVDADRMRANLDTSRGLLMSERVALLLSERTGRDEAHQLIRSASRQVDAGEGALGEVLKADDTVRRYLSAEEIDMAMDPGTYIGSAHLFIDRALAYYRSVVGERQEV